MKVRLSTALPCALACVLLSQGCISTDFRPSSDLGAVSYPPVEASSVRVLTSPPVLPFTVLGEIEAYISGYPADKTVLRHIRTMAAQKGANAIVFVRDFSVMAAGVRDTDPDNLWHKRSSLVYEAVRLADASEP